MLTHHVEPTVPKGVAIPTRDDILSAAEDVILARGLTRATTKEIARAAGCAEGSLYNHFRNKQHLLASVVGERLAQFPAFARTFPDRAGQGTVAGNLRDFAAQALAFLERMVPVVGMAVAEGERYRAAVETVSTAVADPAATTDAPDVAAVPDRGPARTIGLVARYVRAEQELGRVADDIDPEGLATALLGACHLRAMTAQTHGQDHLPFRDDDDFLDRLIAGVLAGHEE